MASKKGIKNLTARLQEKKKSASTLVERVSSRKDKRAQSKADKKTAKQDLKATSGFKARRAYKAETKRLKKQGKLDNKLAKKQAKQEAKVAKTEMRTATKQAAYAAGIDPNSWIKDAAGAVTGIAGAFTGGASSLLGKVSGATGTGASAAAAVTPPVKESQTFFEWLKSLFD